jgi:hypothetical protein
VIDNSLYMSSIIFGAWNLSKNHEIGCARLVKLLGGDEGGNGHEDNVILLNIDMFLIM